MQSLTCPGDRCIRLGNTKARSERAARGCGLYLQPTQTLPCWGGFHEAFALCSLFPSGCAGLCSAAAAPQIPFRSVPDFLKLPPDMYLGEVSGVAVNSKGHVFVFTRGNTNGPAYAAAAAQLLEFDANGKFIREIGHNLYAWSFAHTVKIDKEDNIWVTDKGSDMVIKFNPEGRVVMVFGRKQEASDEGTEPLKHPKPPLPAVDGHVPPGDRRGLGCRRQHLHQRRLHQFARRESR